MGAGTAHVDQVGILLNATEMIDAPHSGSVVKVKPYRWSDYLGALAD